MTSLQPVSRIVFVVENKKDSILTSLEQAGFKVDVFHDIHQAEESIGDRRPDLVLIYSEMTQDHGLSFSQKVRELEFNPRSVIVFLVNENNADERIELLRAGADDVITYPVSGKEVAFRIMAHLRRRQETHVNSLTGLPDAIMLSSVLEYCLKEVEDWAILSVDLDNLRVYNETYGENRGDQMIKALAAVLKSVAASNDFLAHRDSDDFLIITTCNNAEPMAEEICRRFDFIAPRFYTPQDAKRGYVTGVGPRGIRRRIPLVSISIGVTAKGRRHFTSAIEVLQVARDMRYLAKSKSGSDWVSDRLRLSANGQTSRDRKVKILVVEPDASMCLLLRDTLEIEGYAVDTAHNFYEAWQLVNNWHPELILLEADLPYNDMDGWELTRKIKQTQNLAGIWLVITTKNPDHDKALEYGADLYLPKPFELHFLFSEIRYLLRGRVRSGVTL